VARRRRYAKANIHTSKCTYDVIHVGQTSKFIHIDITYVAWKITLTKLVILTLPFSQPLVLGDRLGFYDTSFCSRHFGCRHFNSGTIEGNTEPNFPSLFYDRISAHKLYYTVLSDATIRFPQPIHFVGQVSIL
jgi:hypothetical protein